ncbi:methylthioribulose 1-phosphate dehydratase [Candidatus Methylomicrobium oryzae]|jgi:methylthioribulose-1-phosphate dehydratase|uniref:methylthioribulose 1-phosphate dehydratase n=1 Tax=Candidatus Methylomicrobium oryzae TaxID=2802053 RepID=UPI00192322E6|nr:methylthioribulose 1-phosphate dehydratase [Methylomicrobium sp. RS1]MBL1263254.1 methylthioribulose 1-phosphate dehydratase [Methylomicrobium sp. RS1]
MKYSEAFLNAAADLCEAGRFIDGKGWVPATSGNFSVRLPDGTIAITVSGKHKGRLQIEDIMLIDADANPLDDKKPSAETLLHTSLYKRFPAVNCVLHPHTIHSVLVSRIFKNEIALENYELLKAFKGIATHEARLVIPVFANDQDIPRLAAEVERYLDRRRDCYGYVIAGHGFYTWGDSVAETLRHLEALDYLFECELRLYGVNRA